MLRISRLLGANLTQTIQLEGKLLWPWVDVVRQACASATDLSERVGLDLSAVTFVDAAGEKLLQELIGRDIEVVACSSYVAELLRTHAGARRKDPESPNEGHKSMSSPRQ